MSLTSGKILTLNAGSSSLKFKIFDYVSQRITPIAWGVCERVGEPTASSFKAHCKDGTECRVQIPFGDHSAALQAVSDYLKDKMGQGIVNQVVGVGHRVVHGRYICDPVQITDDVKQAIVEAAELAPIHNPANLKGIVAAEKTFPIAVQVAVFDTAFHQTMPAEAYTYSIPRSIAEKYHLRKYGFHGTSYKYLASRAADIIGKPLYKFNSIIMHLGAGASMCCIQHGVSVDTTMGLTPLQGLMMATRSGDIDPSIVAFLASKGMNLEDIETMLNKKSGFLGLTGESDVREVHKRAESGDERAALALAIFVKKVRDYLGSYMVQLNGCIDAIIFSAGIGEHDWKIRKMICADLEWCHITLNDSKNSCDHACSGDASAFISDESSKVKVLVLPTDEEHSIAEQVAHTLSQCV